MNTMNRRCFCTACAGLLLGACADVKLPVDLGSITGTNRNAGDMDGVGVLPPPPQRSWPDPKIELNKARADGYGLVPMPEMEAYLNGLLATIKKTAGTPGYPGSVHIIADTALNANSDPAGHIFMSVGWLQSAETEDEIFAILSHEFGHIYLNHHAIFDVRSAGQRSVEVVSLAWSVANKPPTANSWTGIDNVGVVDTLGTRVMFPAWQRSIEEQADRFGATISLRCNYSYIDGFKAFFERVITYDQQAKERRQKLREQQAQVARAKASKDAATKAHSQPVVPVSIAGSNAARLNQLSSLSALSDAVSSYTSIRSDTEVGLTQSAFDLQQMIENQIDEQMDALHDDHGDPAAREESLTKLVRPVMGDKRPDPRKEPWEAAKKRGATPTVLAHYASTTDVVSLQAAGQYGQALDQAQRAASGVTANDAYPLFLLTNLMALAHSGSPDAQTQALRRNRNSRDPSWLIQANLARHIAANDPRQGESFLMQQFDYFDRAPAAWPSVVAYYRERGNVQHANELAQTCSLTYPEMKTACVAAAKAPTQQAKADSGNEFDKARSKVVDWAKSILPK
ncbi:M48 family metalloprotease [Caballeronia sp. INDeC2]|uniref:M48 family metalloprotease n=1 Tax=Caballeronia sp. INDeC2 TaxID=2921747 RepID=UPI002028DE61|nr:M48 family metalloprotease [Caballeronia sp. INDeC2]